MDKNNQPKKIKKQPESKPLGYLKKPSFNLQEESFFVERENLLSGLWRGLKIFYEYMYGFYVFRDVQKCITLFGSARFKEGHEYYELAQKMGKVLAEVGFTVMTGGGPGLMEAANRGAREGKGRSIGCNIKLPPTRWEDPNLFLDKKISLHFFFVRKVMLTKYSSGFVFLPGGMGTLDELFEMSTLIQTEKIKKFPLVLLGIDYWAPLIEFMRGTLIKHRTILPQDIDPWLVTDSPEEALEFILNNLKLN